MARSRIRLETRNCERCGKAVATTTRSVLGMDDLKSAFGIYCQSCTSPSEILALLYVQGQRIVNPR